MHLGRRGRLPGPDYQLAVRVVRVVDPRAAGVERLCQTATSTRNPSTIAVTFRSPPSLYEAMRT
jgi:hypothetical protein